MVLINNLTWPQFYTDPNLPSSTVLRQKRVFAFVLILRRSGWRRPSKVKPQPRPRQKIKMSLRELAFLCSMLQFNYMLIISLMMCITGQTFVEHTPVVCEHWYILYLLCKIKSIYNSMASWLLLRIIPSFFFFFNVRWLDLKFCLFGTFSKVWVLPGRGAYKLR